MTMDLRQNPILKRTYDEAVAEGLANGHEEGGALATRTALTKLLQRRFGAVPDWVHARIGAAPLSQLEDWTERIVEADSVETVAGKRIPG